MKKVLFIGIIISIMLAGCKSQQMEGSEHILKKIDSKDYIFNANTALPNGYPSVPLSYGYSLKVSGDTVNAYLPFYGRAYTAPMGSDDGGIKFVTTDAVYTSNEKKNGREITITTTEPGRKITLYLTVQESGYATLIVNDPNRVQISFYGKIE
ncbi:DUF4251 domain-containing protein [Dysgonomonas sp. 520]|uniref:DUF4251 domain-containing protein n=1 Tax=Dysgonomonas sp. 520 TaxID=2302931 RepID=UPI0013D8C34A|nr:DUF4251 domain-containing protein [Dysgonomonas sp. 520]NDW11071.1 DUF4251 domain-containing protein [Dysgonomonas sp. 520]